MESNESFRNSLATVDKDGKRIWVYPTKPKGHFHRARAALAMVLLAFLFSAPFIKLSGNPLLQFDIINRKFFIFGIAFWPHDFFIFVLCAIAMVVFVILFTAVYGRIFCGWVCPQTIFMEMVFRKIEYLIEGSAAKQRKLNRAEWTIGKVAKKTTKHLVFFAISFAIGNTFLAYIIGVDALREIISSPPAEHLTGFTAMIIFSLIFYYVFAFFREQVCCLVCPYGRLQSVMLDSNSIIVAYDHKRGEPRGSYDRAEDRSDKGDCVDCGACVRVCPTGIDIRNGTQLECINCTACIDACDKIMLGIKKPTGLIKYSSQNQIDKGESTRSTTRLAIYTFVLVVLISLVSFMMFSRSDTETTILRAAGTLYEELPSGDIRNLYTIKVVNKMSADLTLKLKTKGLDRVKLTILGPPLELPSQSTLSSVFSLEIAKSELFSSSKLILIEVYSGDELLEEVRTSFASP